ncbi:helix-turn-helix domain-containing protein, partial [Streptococcus hyovaginalis]
MKKYSHSKEEKLEILNFYNNSHFTLNEVSELYKVNTRTIKDWQNNYLFFGEDGLERQTNHNNYSKEVKLGAVQDYISGKYSLRETVR